MALALFVTLVLAAASGSRAPQCRPDGGPVRLAELPEASGIAASRTVPGRLWAHNDSGAILFALDAHGGVTARLPLPGIEPRDWEAIATGQCANAPCLYVADIGDNSAARKEIVVYRLSEPAGGATVPQSGDALRGRYPDGPQDAESLLVGSDGSMFIVTKGSTGPIALYRFPREARPDAAVVLERVGQPRTPGKVKEAYRITDGTVSPDGKWVVLRTHQALLFHPADRLLAGDWSGERVVDISSLGEPQGEGVAVGADGSIFLAGEGGGKSRPGTFVRLRCDVPQSP